jgi:hypothetical protein
MTFMVLTSKDRLLARWSMVALAVSHKEQCERVKRVMRAEYCKRRDVGCILQHEGGSMEI